MSNVTVADDAAGKETTCPNCGKSFPTPARYTAAVSELGAAVAAGAAGVPAPPPGLAPAAPPAPASAAGAAPPGLAPGATDGFAAPPASAGVPALAGYTKTRGITVSPAVVAWLPAALLTALLLLTFFPWVGSYAGGGAVYSQRPWGALLSGTPNRDFRLEERSGIPSNWLNKTGRDWVLLPFFACLLVGVGVAWAERAIKAPRATAPPVLLKVWPWRNSIVAGCAAVALLFLLWQLANRFGMERAIQQQISEDFAKDREKAAGSPADLAKVEDQEKQKFRAYDVEWTTPLYLALLCNVLAVGAVVTRVALEKRGNKPPPKLLLHY